MEKMEYKELIELLRDESNCDVLDYIDEAATAIETLLAERDAAVEMLRGECRVCKNNPPAIAPTLMGKRMAVGKCTTCIHASRSMLLPVNTTLQGEDNWQLRDL